MNIYKLTWDIPEDSVSHWASCVVVAPSEEDAKKIHPAGEEIEWSDWRDFWAESPAEVSAILVGTALSDTQEKIICASYE